jgi:uncharacterized membrane protein YkvA (DUF1232 family)
MTPWQWAVVTLGVVVLAYAGAVALLLALGRRGDAVAMARFVPDCVVLFRALHADGRLARAHRLVLVAVIGYLVSPIDLVPDFVPVAGQLDDAILVALVLRWIVRSVGEEAIVTHWPGPPQSLRLVLRLAGTTY